MHGGFTGTANACKRRIHLSLEVAIRTFAVKCRRSELLHSLLSEQLRQCKARRLRFPRNLGLLSRNARRLDLQLFCGLLLLLRYSNSRSSLRFRLQIRRPRPCCSRLPCSFGGGGLRVPCLRKGFGSGTDPAGKRRARP